VDATSTPEPQAEGPVRAALFPLCLTASILGLWGFIAWESLVNDTPVTPWGGVALIMLPLAGAVCLLVAARRVRARVRVAPNSSTPAPADADAELRRLLRGGTFYLRREDEQEVTLTEVGSTYDLERLVEDREAAEALPASGDAPPSPAPTGPAPPKRPLLYMFQHVALREAAFDNDPALTEELYGPHRPALPLMHSRSVARSLCEDCGMIPEDYDAAEADRKVFEGVSVRPVRRGGYTAHVVTMPRPKSSPEAYLVAIVHRDDEPREYRRPSPSTRYFTLERSNASLRPLLYEWRRDGSRENNGNSSDPKVDLFVDAVFEHMGVGAAPEAGTGH